MYFYLQPQVEHWHNCHEWVGMSLHLLSDSYMKIKHCISFIHLNYSYSIFLLRSFSGFSPKAYTQQPKHQQLILEHIFCRVSLWWDRWYTNPSCPYSSHISVKKVIARVTRFAARTYVQCSTTTLYRHEPTFLDLVCTAT